jgi:chromosomal replication initiation ATPase DnaA
MPQPPFLGRTKALKAFRRAPDDVKEKNNDLPYVFLLYGQGGMGKTKLAKAFRKLMRQDHEGDLRLASLGITRDAYDQLLADLEQRITESPA